MWVLVAFAMYVQRSKNDRFAAMQDEIEELKARISQMETRDEQSETQHA